MPPVQQQQQQPLLNNANNNANNNNNNRSWFNLLLSIIARLILWPISKIINILFPIKNEIDGLSNAVTAKAAQQFVQYLHTLQPQRNNTNSDNTNNELWSTMSFASIRQEAVTNKSLILLYLHAPMHKDSKIFCQNILCSEQFNTFLQQHTNNIIPIGLSIHTAQGAQLQSMLQVTAFPVLVVLQPSGSSSSTTSSSTNTSSTTLSLVLKAEGMVQCSNLLPHIQSVLYRHQSVLNEMEARRILRQQESELRRQQDEEYQATLRADQERERQLQQEREAALQAAAAEQEAQRQQEEQKANIIKSAKELLAKQQPSDSNVTSVNIRFCLPSGTKINSKFYSNSTIATLKAYIRVYYHDNNIDIGTIGLSTNFPRRTYNDPNDDNKTLQDADLVPQAVLMVQDLDA